MKFNNECVRDILKEVELIPYGKTITVEELHEKLPMYTMEDFLSMVAILNREHYIFIVDKGGYNDFDIFRENRIRGLTERGYRNLDLIREDRVWNLIKEKISNFDQLSFFMITSIASKIANYEHNKIFEFDDNLIIDYARW